MSEKKCLLVPCLLLIAMCGTAQNMKTYRPTHRYKSADFDSIVRSCPCSTYTPTLLFHNRLINYLPSYLQSIIDTSPSLDSIRFNSDRRYMMIYFNSRAQDDIFHGQNYFGKCWSYIIFHDIYGAIFSFDEVQYLSIFKSGRPFSVVPMIAEYDEVLFPDNIVSRQYYTKCLDYFSVVDFDNNENFSRDKTYLNKRTLLNIFSKKGGR